MVSTGQAVVVRLVAELRQLRQALDRTARAVDDLAGQLDLDLEGDADIVLLDEHAPCTCAAGGPTCRRHGGPPV